MEHVQISLLGPAAGKKAKIQYKFGRCLDFARKEGETDIPDISYKSLSISGKIYPTISQPSKPLPRRRRRDEGAMRKVEDVGLIPHLRVI